MSRSAPTRRFGSGSTLFTAELPALTYNKYGKPAFAEHPEVQFNLSHTRGAVLVGIHDRPIGVDIERIRPVSERTMQRLAGAVT